jgi:hypothetical protein
MLLRMVNLSRVIEENNYNVSIMADILNKFFNAIMIC